MHPTFLPEEALAHADAVCAWEAEGVWPRIVEDARAGRLGGAYTTERSHPLAGLKPPPRHPLAGRHYATVQAAQATRGCPNRCAFCSVSAFHQGSLRCRPVAEVAAEVAALRKRFLLFVDDCLRAESPEAALPGRAPHPVPDTPRRPPSLRRRREAPERGRDRPLEPDHPARVPGALDALLPLPALQKRLNRFATYATQDRPHQGLEGRTPERVHHEREDDALWPRSRRSVHEDPRLPVHRLIRAA